MKHGGIKNSNGVLVLFSFTLFLSATLMFGLQPMVGKMLLPIVGGTPSGWIVAMAFFQVMLLAGYFVAHGLSRFATRAQGAMYLLCLGIGAFFLPTSLAHYAGMISSTPMAFDVFVLLTIAVAVPFVALSATASTLQKLFTTTGHASAKDPYFLYAASNCGSFAGLLLYPFFVEPNSTLTSQSHGWFAGYVLLMGLVAGCILLSTDKAPSQNKNQKPRTAIHWKKRLEWICLAFIPSGLLLAVTLHITTDIFSVPLLWVIPLGVYLLTFIIAFSKKPFVGYNRILMIQPVAVATVLGLMFLTTAPMKWSWYAMGINLAGFAVVALMCHMRLARSRPVDEDHRHLTDFYLMISFGGALGGILGAFIAPALFDSLVEYPILLIASSLLNENIRSKMSTRDIYAFFAGSFLSIVFTLLHARGILMGTSLSIFLIAIFILLTVHPRALLIGGLFLFLGVSVYKWSHPSVLTERNFYGIIKIIDSHDEVLKPGTAPLDVRKMQHGTTLHGLQILNNKKLEVTPTTYFTREGPLGDVMSAFKPKTVAVIGLGVGTINCYATPATNITFFEIDPAVIKLAKEQFTFLSKCGNKMPRIILGDGRLELKKLENEKFDLIILDAFSSDTIPTHLLTKEAVEVYLQRLAPGGIILMHISTRFFNLDAPIASIGDLLGLKNVTVTRQGLPQPYASPSRWIALSRTNTGLRPLAARGWSPVILQKKPEPWTDDYSDLLSTLNF